VEPEIKHNVFNEISLLLDYSERIYQEYLKSENQFIYANILRSVNSNLYNCLIKGSCYLNLESRRNAIELMLHLDVWKQVWDYEFEFQKPNLMDKFTFENEVKFPSENVKKLMLELASLDL
jgi:hypothetical protein